MTFSSPLSASSMSHSLAGAGLPSAVRATPFPPVIKTPGENLLSFFGEVPESNSHL